jgi:LTXXQ motif family protein
MPRCVIPADRLIQTAVAMSAFLVAPGAPWGTPGVWAGAAPAAAGQEVLLAQAGPNVPPRPNVEASISNLHQRLQIGPAQEAPFNAVANIMRENARAEASAPHQPPPNATVVDELRAEIQYDEVELAGMKKLLPALEALYATLSPAQKKTADMVFRQGPGG